MYTCICYLWNHPKQLLPGIVTQNTNSYCEHINILTQWNKQREKNKKNE